MPAACSKRLSYAAKERMAVYLEKRLETVPMLFGACWESLADTLPACPDLHSILVVDEVTG